MILFNYSITLDYFNLIQIPSSYLYRVLLPGSIASIFIFLSGVSAYAGHLKHKEKFAGRYFKRGLKLLFFSFLITMFTYLFVPQYTVIFGILHFFGVTSFFIPVFIKYNKFNLVAGVSIFLTGIYLQQQTFNFSYLLWLGFVPRNFSTFDYFPLIPWAGIMMLGIYYGGYTVDKLKKIKFEGKFADASAFLGRHSLTIYLIHQPVLILLLAALRLIVFHI